MSDDFLSDEDKALFRKTMGDVKPLDKTKRLTFRNPPPLNFRKQSMAIVRPDPVYELSNSYPESVSSYTLLHYGEHVLPHKQFRQLKQGKIPWQTKLDLHGLNVTDARDSLSQFIEQHYQSNHRCILIIHGKGSQHGEAPILKNHVNHWLRQITHVLAFHSALPKDGGAGALYVLLKRQR